LNFVGLSLAELAIDPVNEMAGLGIDTRVSSFGTAIAPGDNTAVNSITGHWATRVTLAGVLAFLTGADHLVGKQVLTIGILAISIRDERDLDELEDVWQREVAAVEGAPTGNDGSTGSELLALLGESNSLDFLSKFEGLGQAEEADVIADGGVVKVLVGDDFGNLAFLFGTFFDGPVVLAGDDGDVIGVASVAAMAGSQNEVLVDNSPTANVGSILLEGNLEGDAVLG